jgi:uncharacterized protein (DUF1778 family)
MAKSKTKSGGAKLIESGKRAVLLGVEPGDHWILSTASKIEKRPVTQFLIYHALAAARKIIKSAE